MMIKPMFSKKGSDYATYCELDELLANYGVPAKPLAKTAQVLTVSQNEAEGIVVVGTFPANEYTPDRVVDIVYRLAGGAQARLLLSVDYLEDALENTRGRIEIFAEDYRVTCESQEYISREILVMLLDLERFLQLKLAELKREDYQTKLTNNK